MAAIKRRRGESLISWWARHATSALGRWSAIALAWLVALAQAGLGFWFLHQADGNVALVGLGILQLIAAAGTAPVAGDPR